MRSLRHQREKADSRLMLLQQRNRDAYEAIMWLRRNQDRFRSPIIEPIILVVCSVLIFDSMVSYVLVKP